METRVLLLLRLSFRLTIVKQKKTGDARCTNRKPESAMLMLQCFRNAMIVARWVSHLLCRTAAAVHCDSRLFVERKQPRDVVVFFVFFLYL